MVAEPPDTPERSENERQLVEETQRGDRRAMETLIARHLPTLRAFVRLRVNSFLRAHESESDVVQSVCCEILEHVEGFVYQGEARFRNWLYGAVLNKVRQKERYYRAERRNPRREVPLGGMNLSDVQLLDCYRSFCTPSQDAANHEQLARVEAALEELPEQHREVIALAKIIGLPQAEIAQEMGRTISSVRSLLGRALVRLSGVLEQMGSK